MAMEKATSASMLAGRMARDTSGRRERWDGRADEGDCDDGGGPDEGGTEDGGSDGRLDATPISSSGSDGADMRLSYP